MKAISTLKIFISRQMTVIAIIALAAFLAGVSGLIYPSSYSPLSFLGGIVCLVTFIVWLAKPAWALYAALILVFLPLGLIPANIHSILNRSVTVIAIGVWLVRLLTARKKIMLTGSALFMLFFLAWSSLTLFWAEKMSPATNALQVYSLRFLLFLFLIPNEISTKRDLDGMMKTLALSGWVLMLSVVSTLLLDGYTAGSRLKIFGENENGAGVLALVTMVGVVWQASQPSKDHRRLNTLIAAIFIMLTFGLVAMSGSRGSALSLLVTFCAFCLWKPLRSWGAFGLLVAILAIICTPSIFITLIERFAIQPGDTMLGGREVLWQAAWQVIQDHPLGGVGIGNSPYAVLRHLQTDLRIQVAATMPVHNPILAIWSETALLGILFYVGALISALYSFARQYLKFKNLAHNELISYFAVVLSITLGYLVSWIKGGGMESDFSYFLILALLTLPSVLDVESFDPVLSAR